MDINKEYKQISISDFKAGNYNALSGKVVDKVAFTNTDGYDIQMIIITFTDKTFIAAGVDYNDSDGRKDEPMLENHWILPPQNVNGGDYSAHSWVDNSSGKLRFEEWINILRDLDIWKFTDEDAKAIMDKNAQQKEELEYKQYLLLKEKYEKK